MYQTSAQFHNAILDANRKFKAKLQIGEIELIEGIRSVKLYGQTSGDNFVTIGGAFSSYIEMEMWQPDISLENSEAELSIGLLVGEDMEWVPLGLFTIQQTQNDDGVLKFSAYDRIQSKMSGAYFSELTYPVDGKVVFGEISKKTGVPIQTDSLPDGILIHQRENVSETGVDDEGNEIVNTSYVNPFDGYTYREALGYLAQFYGKTAVAGRTGEIELRGYNETEYTVLPGRYYDDLVLRENVFAMEAISCQTGNTILRTGSGTESIQIENPIMTKERLDNIYEQVKDLQFLPAGFSFLGETRLDLGDIITVQDKKGNSIKVPVMYQMLDYDGGLITALQSFGGRDSEAESIKGPTAQKLDRTYTELFLVKELIGNKASFDYVHAVDADFKNVKADYGEYKKLVAGDFQAVNGRFDSLSTKYATIENLNVQIERVEDLEADYGKFKIATTDEFTAQTAAINKVSGDLADYKTVIAGEITAVNGQFDSLSTKYAAIDLANIATGAIKTAMIGTGAVQTAQIADGSITDAKVVNLTANKITAGTLSVERLEIRGSTDSIVYALNNITGALQAQNVNTLNGEVLTPRTITADRIVAGSITGDEIATKTLTANHIVANSITGDEIAAGTITSNKIDTEELFSQNITATNLHITEDSTFEGVLNGATGSFSGDVTANGKIQVATGKVVGGIQIEHDKSVETTSMAWETNATAFPFFGIYSSAYQCDVFSITSNIKSLFVPDILMGKEAYYDTFVYTKALDAQKLQANTATIRELYVGNDGYDPGLNIHLGDTSLSTVLNRKANASEKMYFDWLEQNGQPTWVWGTNGQTADNPALGKNMSLYNPSQFRVASMVVADTRDTNPAPNSSDFLKTTVRFEFKRLAALGLASNPLGFAGNFTSIMSLAPWSETTGGHGYQMAYGYSSASVPKLAIRAADLSASEWGNWYKIYTSADKPSWNEILNKPSTFTASSHDHTSISGTAAKLAHSLQAPQYGDSTLYYFYTNVANTTGPTVTAVPEANRWYYIIRTNHGNANGYYADLAIPFEAIDSMAYRTISYGKETTWKTILDSNNYNTVTGMNYAIGTNWKAITPYSGDGTTALGTSANRYTNVYAKNSVIQTSDEREKYILSGVTDPYEEVFMDLKPILYKWKNFGNEIRPHDRIHCGLGAQTTYGTAQKYGLDFMNFAAICKDDFNEPLEDGRTDRWGIAYEELISLNIHMTQKALKHYDRLNMRVEQLENQLQTALEKIDLQEELIKKLQKSAE